AMAVGTILHYIKILKKVRISNRGIKSQSLFKSEFIPWESVKKIELLGKTDGNGFVAPLEATILELKDGQKFELLASFYKNIGALRKSLEQVAESLGNESPIKISSVTERAIAAPVEYMDLNRMSKFSGNHFLSLNGAIIYGWVSFSVYSIFWQNPDFPSSLSLVILTLLSGFFYGFLGYQLHYFYLGKDYLVVKNHVWPWVYDVYRIDEIRQVVFEMPYRRSLSMRVITEDYQSRLYPAGSLRKNHWKTLLKQLQDLGIDIRNETLLEQPISSDSRI
ncbi:MAG TPA: hypothetical protein VLA71_20565, partial [Algoriphagus sp.]|nr:hypothetical protein [Algoriphagus sp.]